MKFKDIIKEFVILEVTRKSYNDFMDRLPDRPLPFDNDLFGGKSKKRIVVPFISELMKKIKSFLEKSGYKINLDSGIGSKTIKTNFGNKNVELRIGKILNKEYDSLKKEIGNFFNYFEQTDIKDLDFSEYSFEERQSLKLQPHFEFRYNNPENKFFYRRSNMRSMTIKEIVNFINRDIEEMQSPQHSQDKYSQEYLNDLKKLQSVVNSSNKDSILKFYELEKLIKDYNKEGTGLSYVISRAPIDVLRMSDFKNIQSCHSEGGGYWNCAVEEGSKGGAVVFLVKNESLKNINLDDEEIFSDPDRDIKGIQPLSRVRLRRFKHKFEEYDIAIPETRIYGQQIPGFLEGITEWSFQKQKHKFENSELELEYPDMDDFILTGGSYRDNSASELFNNFFSVSEYHGDTEVEDSLQNLEQQYREECIDFLSNFNDDKNYEQVFAGFSIDHDDYEGGNYVSVNAEGGFFIDIKKYLPNNEQNIFNKPDERFSKLKRYVNTQLLDVKVSYLEFINGNLYFRIDSSEINTPDEFDNFLNDLKQIDQNYPSIYNDIITWLADQNIIEIQENHKKYLEIIDNNPFENIEDIEYDEKYIKFEFQSKSISLGNHYIIDSITNKKNIQITEIVKNELKKRFNSITNSSIAQIFIPGIEPIKNNNVPNNANWFNVNARIRNSSYSLTKRHMPILKNVNVDEDHEDQVSLIELSIDLHFGFTFEEYMSKMSDDDFKDLLQFMKYMDDNCDDIIDFIGEVVLKSLFKMEIIKIPTSS